MTALGRGALEFNEECSTISPPRAGHQRAYEEPAPHEGKAYAIMGTVSDPQQLIIAAAQAAGPCPPGLEAPWHNRVRQLALDLYLNGVQLAADINRVQGATPVRGVLTRVEMEGGNVNRALIWIKPLARGEERFRTDWLDNDSGKQVLALAERLVGRLVRVYKTMETKKSTSDDRPADKVRVAVHLVDLGPAGGAVAEKDAKEMMMQAVGGSAEHAATAWQAAGLPNSGPVAQDELERAIAAIRPVDDSDTAEA